MCLKHSISYTVNFKMVPIAQTEANERTQWFNVECHLFKLKLTTIIIQIYKSK